MPTQSPIAAQTHPQVELGCGAHKRDGFYGIDVAPGAGVDLVLDIEQQPLPFPDDSVEHLYSSHTFEHLVAVGSPIQTLREIVRVMRDGGLVEIWTPFGRSDDGLLFGHGVFYTETHWKHICYMYDDFYLGEGTRGRFDWERTEYVAFPGVLERLDQLGIPLDFALDHMSNVAMEFGVFLRVDKSRVRARSPQVPRRDIGYQRGHVIRTVRADAAVPGGSPQARPGALPALRRRLSSSPAGPMLRELRDVARRAVGLRRH